MPIVPAGAKILVTGANGFAAVWLIRELLQKAYSVRGVVRAASKGEHVKKLFSQEIGEGRLEICVVHDITAVRMRLTLGHHRPKSQILVFFT
jgi:nucleoside-diphosphate-sugar epimerase